MSFSESISTGLHIKKSLPTYFEALKVILITTAAVGNRPMKDKGTKG